jgi:polyisoprenoid-binding protein YceI
MTRSIITALLLAVLAATATAGTWRVGEGSEAVFISKATLESFDGKTRQVRGHLTFDADHLAGPLDMRVEVDLASLDTGIGMRNRHMRERHLETDTFPVAVFTGESIVEAAAPALRPGETVALTVQGQFELHGVTQPLTVSARATLATDGSLTAVAQFVVKLTDHDIDRPGFLLLRLADEQQVEVTLVARPEAE